MWWRRLRWFLTLTALCAIAKQAETGTYKAAVVRDFAKPLEIEQVSKKGLGLGQVRVKIEASGLCHTDIHAAHGETDADAAQRPRGRDRGGGAFFRDRSAVHHGADSGR